MKGRADDVGGIHNTQYRCVVFLQGKNAGLSPPGCSAVFLSCLSFAYLLLRILVTCISYLLRLHLTRCFASIQISYPLLTACLTCSRSRCALADHEANEQRQEHSAGVCGCHDCWTESALARALISRAAVGHAPPPPTPAVGGGGAPSTRHPGLQTDRFGPGPVPRRARSGTWHHPGTPPGTVTASAHPIPPLSMSAFTYLRHPNEHSRSESR